jgi:tetraacyldisaccharide 4'-kinase
VTGSTDALRARGARALERGRSPGAIGRAGEAVWEALAAPGVRRPLRLPARSVVGVGGAVLGGAGKTPLAIAVARELSRRGHRVALVGHAYRARPGAPRTVSLGDAVEAVGDDALWACRALEGDGVAVVVGPTRQAAVDHAAAVADVLVVDGLLQTRPHPLDVALLVGDARAPWGSGRCPPLGDLRAPRRALLEAADLLVLLDADAGAARIETGIPSVRVTASTTAAEVDGAPVPLVELRSRSVGVIVGIARPQRVARTLQAAGVSPTITLAFADHARMRAADLGDAARAPVDLWLTTARCATKLPARIGSAPVAPLRQVLAVESLVEMLDQRLTAKPGRQRRANASHRAFETDAHLDGRR